MKKKVVFLLFPLFIFGMTAFSQDNTVSDIEGNVYKTVTLGSQKWMTENLKTTKYNDGSSIPLVADNTEWQNLENSNPDKEGFCFYENNIANYGGYYSYQVVKTNKLCPTGWHVPLNKDWQDFKTFLSDNNYSWSTESYNKKQTAKSLASTSGWKSTDEYSFRDGYVGTDQASNNKTGFTAVPAGHRKGDGSFSLIGEEARFACFLNYNDITNIYAALNYNSSELRATFQGSSGTGINVRCIEGSVTAINNINSIKGIRIFPNPVTDKLVINLADKQGLRIKVYNVVGDCVLQSDLTNGINSLDFSKLKKGIYLIHLTGADKTYQQKLIKE